MPCCAACLGTPTVGTSRRKSLRAASASTLKFVPYADLALLDPLVSAFVTRNHVMMVFDTLFALDANGEAQPQMLAGYTVEDGGKTWKLTLRDGLVFHDGSKVLARDVVASLRRWAVKDAFGQALMDATDEVIDVQAPPGSQSSDMPASVLFAMAWRAGSRGLSPRTGAPRQVWTKSHTFVTG